jgi:hypothetical protein
MITADKLFEPPFTEINDNGLLGVFSKSDADAIVKTIDQINMHAIAL